MFNSPPGVNLFIVQNSEFNIFGGACKMALDESIQRELKMIVSGRVLFDEPMDRHTSIGVGGKADAVIYPSDADELGRIIAFLKSSAIPFMPIGNCTNLIVRDAGYRGVLVSLRSLKGMSIAGSRGHEIVVSADAGVALFDLVRLTAENSLTGMEFLAGIPGSVGGAVKMNAGAYGHEMKDTVCTVFLMNGSGRIKNAGRHELEFEYRNLDLPQDTVILGAEFLLKKGSAGEIRQRIQEILEARRKRHPLRDRSAGSVFKNPKGVPAGMIIDEVGLKGMRIGDAKISEMHGNFIVNAGHAKAGDILSIISFVQRRVLEEKGILLEPEVRIIGEVE
ncbi:MAG: UDP-N-acetylmuramate dehydrogenase [Syntrophales bacterium]